MVLLLSSTLKIEVFFEYSVHQIFGKKIEEIKHYIKLLIIWNFICGKSNNLMLMNVQSMDFVPIILFYYMHNPKVRQPMCITSLSLLQCNVYSLYLPWSISLLIRMFKTVIKKPVYDTRILLHLYIDQNFFFEWFFTIIYSRFFSCDVKSPEIAHI